MRVVLGIAAAAIIASPVAWTVEAPRTQAQAMACHHEGDAAVEGNQLAVCRKGVWELGPIDSARLLD